MGSRPDNMGQVAVRAVYDFVFYMYVCMYVFMCVCISFFFSFFFNRRFYSLGENYKP